MNNPLAATATELPILGNVEAYCVFQRKDVSRVLNKDQFEKLVDGDEALSGFSGPIQFAYVVISPLQLIQAMVLFSMPLDARGFCPDGWRLPLQRLSNSAGRGPNLGGGRIRLACHSQCAISWHKDSLWDPTTNTFTSVKKAIMSDFKQLIIKAEYQSAEEGESQSQAAVSSADKSVEILRRELRNETAAYRNQLQSLQQEIERQRLLNERMADKIANTSSIAKESQTLDERQLRLENDRLMMKIRELQLSNQKLREVQKDRVENHAVETDGLLKKMQGLDIMSVVYHAGVGHVNLTVDQLVDYLDDPIAYAAHQIDITKAHYQIWLAHEKNCCCHVCDVKIPLVADPAIFDEEHDIYCEDHKPLDA